MFVLWGMTGKNHAMLFGLLSGPWVGDDRCPARPVGQK